MFSTLEQKKVGFLSNSMMIIENASKLHELGAVKA